MWNALRVRFAHIQRTNYLKFWGSEKPAELVGAKPLHLLTQTALPLKSPTGAFIAAQTRAFQNPFFTGGVVEENGRCSAAFCESAALRAGTCSPLGELSRSD